MRYFAGFIGGFVVAVLLLVFQQQLIGSDHEHLPQPTPTIALDSVLKSRPAEDKPRETRELPPEPEVIKPDAPTAEPHATNTIRPTVFELPVTGVENGHGGIPQIVTAPGVTDGGAMVMVPVEPQYPLSAVRNSIEGEVEVEFTVLADGRVADVEVIRANPRGVFEQSAVRAVLRWQFTPKRQNGVPVPTRMRQVIEFELPDAR